MIRGQAADLKEFVNIALKNTSLEIDLGNCLFLSSEHIRCKLPFSFVPDDANFNYKSYSTKKTIP